MLVFIAFDDDYHIMCYALSLVLPVCFTWWYGDQRDELDESDSDEDEVEDYYEDEDEVVD